MLYIITAAVIVADLISKYIAADKLAAIKTIPIIENIFHLTYVENRGIAFGMFSGGRIVFIIISLAIILVLAVILKKSNKEPVSRWLNVGAALIFGGAIGNLTDRIINGYVVDFLDFRLINFPVFNIADIAVCIGAVMLLIHFLAVDNGEKQESAEAEEIE